MSLSNFNPKKNTAAAGHSWISHQLLSPSQAAKGKSNKFDELLITLTTFSSTYFEIINPYKLYPTNNMLYVSQGMGTNI